MAALIAEARIASLGTLGPHGPHVAPVWFLYEQGEFRFISPLHSQKARNLRRDPRVGISIEARDPTRALLANGVAALEPLDDPAELERLACRALGSVAAGKNYTARAPNHDRILIRVRPDRWSTFGEL